MQHSYLYRSINHKVNVTHILDVYVCECDKPMRYGLADDSRQPDVGQGRL